jgi:GMP synthase-like glutamine amidotransferase
MILIVNVCSEGFSYFEFVKPVEDIVRKAGLNSATRHYLSLNRRDISQAESVIICGTAMKDFGYLDKMEKFTWIKEIDKPVLGLCAGMQILGKLYDCRLLEKTKIGKYKVKIARKNSLTSKDEFYSYFLNSKAVEPNENFETLGQSGNLTCILKHKLKGFSGCLFHPEVLNQEIIANFISQSASGRTSGKN